MIGVRDHRSTANRSSGVVFSVGGMVLLCCISLITVLVGCSGENAVRPDTTNIDRGGQSSFSAESRHYSGSGQDFHQAGGLLEPVFELEAKYSYIRSHPGGGGVFLVGIRTLEGFAGNVHLSLEADALLNAVVDKPVLNSDSRIAEVTIQPARNVVPGTYRVKVIASCTDLPNQVSTGATQTVSLDVEMIPWGPPVPEYAEAKRNELVKWVEETHPEFGDLSRQKWCPYMTYPGILVVEHWTFLSEDWEMRVCFHVMIPPYDWSMILLRERGEWDPTFAAMREYNGIEYETHEIPISDYPTFYGY